MDSYQQIFDRATAYHGGAATLKALLPIPVDFRPGFEGIGPVIEAAVDDSLIAHRDFIFGKYFRSPME